MIGEKQEGKSKKQEVPKREAESGKSGQRAFDFSLLASGLLASRFLLLA
jgi:hypothetical protein